VSPVRVLLRFRQSWLLFFTVLFVVMDGVPGLAQVAGSATGSGLSNAAPPSSVHGQVVNAVTGQPIPRALVRFNDRAILTDHEGKFEFGQNTEISGNFMVIKPGFAATPDPMDGANTFVQGDQLATSLRLFLYPEGMMTGTILAPDGTPPQNVFVTAQRVVYDEMGHRMMPVAMVQSDSRGNFRLPVPAGDYRIQTQYVAKDRNSGLAILPVSLPDGSSSNTSNEIRIRNGEEQHFELHPLTAITHTVTIKVESASSPGMGFMPIIARSKNGGTLQVNPSFNGTTGEMKLELPQGTFYLKAQRRIADSSEIAEATVTVPDHDISSGMMHFTPVLPVLVEVFVAEGSKSDNAQPPSPTQLNLMLQNDQSDVGQAEAVIRLRNAANQTFEFAAPPGSYHLQTVTNGEWYVRSASAGASDLLQEGLIVASGSSGTPIRVTVSNQTGSLQGNVTLGGVPGSFWVYLIATTPSAQRVFTVRSNREGGYSAAHLPPGSYQVVAFEHRRSVNLADPASLAPFSTHVHSVSIQTGNKASLNLDAVSGAESLP
jgi:hypothetical protein